MTPVWQIGSPGSIPGGSTVVDSWQLIVGSLTTNHQLPTNNDRGWEPDNGLPGRTANAVCVIRNEGSTPSPSARALVVKRNHATLRTWCSWFKSRLGYFTNAERFRVRNAERERGIQDSQILSSFRIPNSALRTRKHSALDLIPWPSGDGTSLTRRRAVVRVHPGSLNACSPWCSGPHATLWKSRDEFKSRRTA